ncbi:MAG: PqqD family protein [Planctomycetes bacterium]|nr:PqqD family protein [Planctomycetota bacterium]
MSSEGNPQIRSEIVIREIDGEYAVYDPVSDRVALLNLSAITVLDLCDGTRTTAEIAMEVSALFSIPEERARLEVDQTLKEFKGSDLLS